MIQDIYPHKLINAYQTAAVPDPSDTVFAFRGKEIALRTTDGKAVFPEASSFSPEELVYLFALDGRTCWGLIKDRALEEPYSYESVRDLRRNGKMERHLVFAAFTALQLCSWYHDNRYCGSCGSLTTLGTTERSILCPSCGRVIYPRIIPAVIVGVTNGDYLLHTKYERSRSIPFYALVAGFTEIGETFEECVAREVMEETGLRVKNIRYYKSQPWGIVDDILAGFYCDVDGDTTVRLDTSELCEGVWIHRKDIVGQPDDASLTHHMMITFRDGNEPKS